MDLERLEEFSALEQAGSFRQAAEALGISPSLLSAHIDSLEKKLGVRLMERDAHRLELTDAGKCFLTDAREIIADYQQTLSAIGTVSRESYRSLRIGMSSIIIPAKLGPYLDLVNLQYPDIHLDIFDDSRFGIAEGLNGGAVDVFFSYCTPELNFEGLTKEPVYTSRVQVLVPMSHRLAYKSSVSMKELDGERFVLYPETAERAVRTCELSLLQKAGIAFSVYDGTVCPTAYFIMVPVGKGLVLCPWVMKDMVPPNTAALFVDDPDFVMTMYMFYRKDCPNPYLPEFLSGFRSFSNRRAGT